MTTHDLPDGDPHDLLAGYLVDALDPDDSERFVAHLSGCVACTAELRSLSQTVADLAEAHRVVPPPEVEDRLMDAVFGAAATSPPAAVPMRPTRRPRWLLPVAAVAALVVGAGLVAGVVALQSHDSDSQVVAVESSRVVSEVMNAPDAHVMALAVPEGSAAIVVSGAMDKAVVTGELPMPGADKEYHVWAVMSDGAMTSAGAFVPDSTGAVAMPLHSTVSGVAGFMMTVEDQGAVRPAGTMLAEVRL